MIPPKQEYVLYVTLSERQINLYREYLQGYTATDNEARSKRLLAGKNIYMKLNIIGFNLNMLKVQVELTQTVQAS